MQEFSLDRAKLARFLSIIESGYSDSCQYHNRAHAASVVHFMHLLLSQGGIANAASSAAPDYTASTGDMDNKRRSHLFVTLAGILAAVVHDYEHPGLNNGFLVNSSNPKAVRYNDKSPNENHHLAAAFEVLQRPECNIFEHFEAKEFRHIRGLVIDLVLSTDMADSGKYLKAFQDASSPSVEQEGSFTPSSPQQATLMLQMALKCADVGHLALGWNLHIRWVQRLESEFFAQGDKEKKLGMPDVSFLMDREKPGVSQTQVGFFDFVVLPLFRSFVGAVPRAQPMLAGVEANYQRWCEIKSDTAACA
jgi:cAMP-specific phosphodiesterase 4/calcium/calmodulin-dependent 3',5'-cyclic nucleotide phosphodiesterase